MICFLLPMRKIIRSAIWYKKMDIQACEKHLAAHLKQGGCKGAAVKIYDDIEKYCEGLKNLRTQEKQGSAEGEAKKAETEILENLLAIAL